MVHDTLLAILIAQSELPFLVDRSASVLTAVSAGATFVAALFGFLIQRRQRRQAKSHAQITKEIDQALREAEQALEDAEQRDSKPRGESILRTTVEARLREAQAALDNERIIERASRWSSHALIGGQFVVGGLLASAFVQETLSATLIGSLGLIVLLSQIIRERFNPEGIGDSARQKISRLNKLIRNTENDLALYDAYQKGYTAENGETPSLHELLKATSDELGDIEDS
jgi:hypothetical protein